MSKMTQDGSRRALLVALLVASMVAWFVALLVVNEFSDTPLRPLPGVFL